MSVATMSALVGAAAGSRSALRLLLAHAAGFCKEMWNPFVQDLDGILKSKGVSAHVIALDFGGHGDTSPPPNPGDWPSFIPTDIVQAIRAFPPSSANTPLVGVGHSMGGAGLLMAAQAQPSLFSKMVLFEPIVPNYEERETMAQFARGAKMLENAAARRKASWPSLAAAQAHFRSHPFTAAWDPRSIEAFCTGALRELPDGSATLKCKPENESKLFTSSHDIAPKLHTIPAPTLFLGGSSSSTFNARHWANLAALMPHAHAETVKGSHFWPMEQPRAHAQRVADFVVDSVARL